MLTLIKRGTLLQIFLFTGLDMSTRMNLFLSFWTGKRAVEYTKLKKRKKKPFFNVFDGQIEKIVRLGRLTDILMHAFVACHNFIAWSTIHTFSFLLFLYQNIQQEEKEKYVTNFYKIYLRGPANLLPTSKNNIFKMNLQYANEKNVGIRSDEFWSPSAFLFFACSIFPTNSLWLSRLALIFKMVLYMYSCIHTLQIFLHSKMPNRVDANKQFTLNLHVRNANCAHMTL